MNAKLPNSIEITPETLVGAGALIIKNTTPKGVYLPQRSDVFWKRSDEMDL